MTNTLNLPPKSLRLRSATPLAARTVVAPTGTIIRGRFPSVTAHRMVAFEQLLERDALYLFEFCPLVQDIHAQPFKFHYAFGDKIRRYTPDYALTLADGSRVIIEIKPSRSLEKPEIKAKFEAIAAAMARQQHRFMVLTDKTIRQEPRLSNFKQLYPFLRMPFRAENRALLSRLHTRLQECGSLSLTDCGPEGVTPSEILLLLAHGFLNCDYTQPIGPQSLVSLTNEEMDHVLIDWL